MLQSAQAQAQGTLYLSTLSPTPTGSVAAGSDSWLAAGFGTGSNPGGYVLNSVQLAMTDAWGDSAGFTVMIYSEGNSLGGIIPGVNLGTLDGPSNPNTAGTYDYITSSSLLLSPTTAYFIVITSSTSVVNGPYNWNESAYPPSVNVWGTDNAVLRSINGTSGWSPTPYLGIAQFAIYATPAPEPGVLGLFALGGLFAAFQRRKTRPVQ